MDGLARRECNCAIKLSMHQVSLSQPAETGTQVAEVFTGSPGKYVDLKDTISGFKGILDGKYDDLPEMAFYMVSRGVLGSRVVA